MISANESIGVCDRLMRKRYKYSFSICEIISCRNELGPNVANILQFISTINPFLSYDVTPFWLQRIVLLPQQNSSAIPLAQD